MEHDHRQAPDRIGDDSVDRVRGREWPAAPIGPHSCGREDGGLGEERRPGENTSATLSVESVIPPLERTPQDPP